MSNIAPAGKDWLERPREPWFLRSKTRLYFLLFVALALPAGVLAFLASSETQKHIVQQKRDELTLTARLLARSVNEQFEGLMNFTRSYADRRLLSEATRTQDSASARPVLHQLVSRNDLISRAFLADTTGVIWVDDPSDPAVIGQSFAHRDWYQGIISGRDMYVSEIYKRQALGQPYTVSIASRMHDTTERFVGILVTQVTVAELAEWLLKTELPERGIITLVDHAGRWVDNSSGQIYAKDSAASSPFDQLTTGKQSIVTGPDPISGVPSLLASSPVASTGWTVIARQPLSEIMAPVWESQRSLLIYFAMCLVCMVFISGSMYRTIRRYDDERNRSQEQLRLAYRGVEEQVRRRTQELTSANFELRRLAAIIESTSDAIGSASLDGTITSWNPAAERIYGYSRDEIVGHSSGILLPEDRIDETRQLLQRVLAGEPVAPIETVRRRKDGTLFDVSLAYSPLFDEAGAIVGASVVARDITRQKLIERQARALERERAELLKRLQMTLERMPIGCILNDTEFRFTYWNPAAERIFGYNFADVEGQHPFDTITPESAREHVTAIFRRLAGGGEDIDAVGENITRDGRRITCVWSNSSLRDSEGRFLGIISMCQDVTEQKRDEERLRMYAAALAQNNRELQDFAFVASHDLQEPLRKISAFGKRLEESAGEVLSDESRDYLDRMQRAAQRMQTLMSDLLDFSRITTRAQPFVATDFNLIAMEVISDLETRIEQTGGRVEVGALPVVEADRVQARQLLQNLIANALKFHRQDVAPLIRVSAAVSGNSCELTVEDNGIGFDQKYLDRIFTPFQRLHGRHEYEGTGMGLAICRKIAERHGGSITAISVPGKGSSFIVTLPIRHTQAGSALWTQKDGPSVSSWPTTTQTTAS